MCAFASGVCVCVCVCARGREGRKYLKNRTGLSLTQRLRGNPDARLVDILYSCSCSMQRLPNYGVSWCVFMSCQNSYCPVSAVFSAWAQFVGTVSWLEMKSGTFLVLLFHGIIVHCFVFLRGRNGESSVLRRHFAGCIVTTKAFTAGLVINFILYF